MSRFCLACGRRPADTLPEWPALCAPCIKRTGQHIKPGVRVICESSLGCSGTVDRLVDGGVLAVVRTGNNQETCVPVIELVRVTHR